MIALYFSSGSSEIQLGEEQPSGSWEKARRHALKFLEQTGEEASAEVLRNTPFELWTGTNFFQDEFTLLLFRTSIAKYVELEARTRRERILIEYAEVARALAKCGCVIRFVAAEMELDDIVESVPSPDLVITASIVERALQDAIILLRTSGASSALDRIHTALHGYLIAVCESAGETIKGQVDITALFKKVRETHPLLQAAQSPDQVARILKVMAMLVNDLNSLRNTFSIAHPNEELLEEPEAMLVINSVRTLLHYLDSRLREK